jgi:hypothetical protein
MRPEEEERPLLAELTKQRGENSDWKLQLLSDRELSLAMSCLRTK